MIEMCPHCGRYPYKQTERTAEVFAPWKDEDGSIYCGPARESIKLTCACGWEKRIERRRGKLVSEVTND